MIALRRIDGPEGFLAVAATHPDFPDGVETLLVVAETEDPGEPWLCVGQAPVGRARSLGFEDGVAREDFPKLCAFLGFPLVELEEHFRRLCEWQQMCLRTMGPNLWGSLERATVEEIAEWRRELQSLETGVLLTAGLTLSDPRAVSN